MNPRSPRFIALGVTAAFSLVAAIAVSQQAALTRDVPYVPTPMHLVERMLDMADVGSSDYVIDLGSGDGRIAIAAARDHGARALGVDIDPQRVKEARENAHRADIAGKVEFRQQDLFETEIGDATVVTMYLLPEVNLRLKPRILSELQPGTRVVSHAFDMGDWAPDMQYGNPVRVRMWIVPARVEGRWQVTDGEKSFSIAIEQEYQSISGTATLDGRTVRLVGPHLHGAEITFSVPQSGGPPREFRGRIDEGRMTALPHSEVADWSAVRTQ